MQAVTIALGAASLVAVPLAFGLWLVRRKGERRHRRLSAGARGAATKIGLFGDEPQPESESEAPRRSRRRSRRTKRHVIDLFASKEQPASPE